MCWKTPADSGVRRPGRAAHAASQLSTPNSLRWPARGCHPPKDAWFTEPSPCPHPAWLLPPRPVSRKLRAIGSTCEIFSGHLLCAGVTLGPRRTWARPHWALLFPPPVPFAPSHAFSTPDGRVTFEKCRSDLVAFPLTPVRGPPLLSENKARFFTQLFLACHQDVSPGSFCCPCCNHTNLASRMYEAHSSYRAFAHVVLTLWNVLSPTYLHNMWMDVPASLS